MDPQVPINIYVGIYGVTAIEMLIHHIWGIFYYDPDFVPPPLTSKFLVYLYTAKKLHKWYKHLT